MEEEEEDEEGRLACKLGIFSPKGLAIVQRVNCLIDGLLQCLLATFCACPACRHLYKHECASTPAAAPVEE